MKPILPTPSSVRGARRQRGFTLVEMMVAVGIGLVVALGFAVSFVNLKATWGTQDKLAQLQDNERLAMAFLTSSIQEAGYFPDSINQTKKTGLPVLTDATYGGTATAGQYIGGALASGGIPVTLSTVYGTASGDGVLNCQGATNTSGANVTYLNIFFVDTTNNTLSCAVTASDGTLSLGKAPLVSNVSSMSVLYAVDTNIDGSADTYFDAGSMNATKWANVKAVRVTLDFINPNAALGGAQAATIRWTQTISLMNNK